MKHRFKRFFSLLITLLLILGMIPTVFAAGETVDISTEKVLYIGSTDYDFYVQYAGYPNHIFSTGPWWTETMAYYVTADGRTAFCIQPHKSQSGGTHTNVGWENIDRFKREAITLAMAYGAPNNGKTDETSIFATQAVVWDMACGYRERDGSFQSTYQVSGGLTINSSPWGNALAAYQPAVYAEYQAILARMAKHGTIPSFSSASKYQISAAQTITLKLDPGTGTYKASVTDTNGVLESFNFTSSVSGLSFSKSGNTLNIEATKDAAKQLSNAVTIRNRGNEVAIGPDLCIVWGNGNGQLQATCPATDPVPCYFNLVAEPMEADVTVVKTSEDNKVDGVSFTVRNNTTGGSSSYTTANGGRFTFKAIIGDSLTITESIPTGYANANSSQTITVSEAGNTVSFYNALLRGNVVVQKDSEDGVIAGRQFRLTGTSYTGIAVNMTATTNAQGKATFSNVPAGTGYKISEVNTPGQYAAPATQTINVNGNQTTNASFSNRLKKWTATVTKTDSVTGSAQGDATLSGAVYGVFQNGTKVDEYTTDANGRFTTKEYICGTGWTIQEITPGEGYLLDTTVYPVGAEATKFTIEHNTISLGVKEEAILGRVAITKIAGGNGTTQIEKPEVGAEFQIYLKSAGSYNNAKESERDTLVCDEMGQATSKELPYGTYVVHQSKGWEDTHTHPDFEVTITEDGKTYPFIINNAWKIARVKVVKQDATTDKVIPVAGVGFRFFDADGQKVVWETVYPEPATVDTFYTGSDGTLVTPFEMKYGEYTAVEVSAPNGYVLDPTPIPFTVSADEIVTEEGVAYVLVEIPNAPQMAVIEIDKKGEGLTTIVEEDTLYKPIYGEVGLSDAVFEIRAAEDIVTPDGTVRYTAGEVVDTVTTADGSAKSKELFLGRYEVQEVAAPDGYVLDPTVHSVELTYAGEDIEITSAVVPVTNERQKVEISLVKELEQDTTFGIGMNGEVTKIRFGLFAAEEIAAPDGSVIPVDGLVIVGNCKEDGTLVFDAELPHGKYYVQEIAADEHYILSDTKYPLEFVNDTATAVAKFAINDGEPIANELIHGTIMGKKVDEDGFAISGAKFGLFLPTETEYTEEKAILVSTSNEIGVFGFENVPYGSYVIRELEPAPSFVLNKTPYKVTIAENEEIVEITVENKFLTGSVTTTKVDADYPENKLTGAAFAIYIDVDGNKEYDATVDLFVGNMEEIETGFYTMTGLRSNGYFLHETAAPENFLRDDGYYYFEIRKNGEIVNIENKAGVGFINEPMEGELELTKTDITDGKLLPGAGFRIRNEAGEVVAEGYTDEKGVAKFTLRVGKYTYREFDAPDNYQLDESEFEFEIKENGEIVKAQMTNTPVPETPTTGDLDAGNLIINLLVFVLSVIALAVLLLLRGKLLPKK